MRLDDSCGFFQPGHSVPWNNGSNLIFSRINAQSGLKLQLCSPTSSYLKNPVYSNLSTPHGCLPPQFHVTVSSSEFGVSLLVWLFHKNSRPTPAPERSSPISSFSSWAGGLSTGECFYMVHKSFPLSWTTPRVERKLCWGSVCHGYFWVEEEEREKWWKSKRIFDS